MSGVFVSMSGAFKRYIVNVVSVRSWVDCPHGKVDGTAKY